MRTAAPQSGYVRVGQKGNCKTFLVLRGRDGPAPCIGVLSGRGRLARAIVVRNRVTVANYEFVATKRRSNRGGVLV